MEENKEAKDEHSPQHSLEHSSVHSEHHNKKSTTEKMRGNPWIVSTFVLGIIALILVIGTFSGSFTGNAVSTQTAGNNLVNFLNKYLVSGGVTLNNVQENPITGIYDANISYNGKSLLMPITKDGQYTDIGGGMININSYIKYIASSTAGNSTKTPSSSGTQTATTVPKADKPIVELYVFAYCPYGLQMEKAILPVVTLLGDKINFQIRQIGAMHGDFEKVEAERQLCIEKNYPTKYLDYVLAFAQDTTCTTGDSACVATKTNSLFTKFSMDANTINSCMTSQGETLYNAEVANAASMGVSGSPTLFINGVEAQPSARSSSSVLTSVCSAFNSSPSECSQTLSSTEASPGFGSSAGTGTGSASCGN